MDTGVVPEKEIQGQRGHKVPENNNTAAVGMVVDIVVADIARQQNHQPIHSRHCAGLGV